MCGEGWYGRRDRSPEEKGMDERSPSLVKKIEEIRDGKEIGRNQFFNPSLPSPI